MAIDEEMWATAYLAQIIMRLLPRWRLGASREMPRNYDLAYYLISDAGWGNPLSTRSRELLEECFREIARLGRYEEVMNSYPSVLNHAMDVLGLKVHASLSAGRPHTRMAVDTEPVQLWPRRKLLDQCFVIMPIAKQGMPNYETYDDRIFTELIPAAVACSGIELKCVRADQVMRQDSITQLVVEQLCRSRLAIADVTWPNPNVWYEAGIRHALCSPTMLMCQEGTRLPFDSHDVQCEFYTWRGDVNDGNVDDFCRRMGARIHEALATPSLAADSLMGRLIDQEMDYWTTLEHQRSDYSPSALVMRAEQRVMHELCARTLQCVFLCMQLFFQDHDDCYPPGSMIPPPHWTSAFDLGAYCSAFARPASWISEVEVYGRSQGLGRRQLRCPLGISGSGYAMNRRLAGTPRSQVKQPDRVPLCFDDTLPQDAAIGTEARPRHPGGHSVLLCDGTIRQIENRNLDRLKWSPQ